MADVQVRTQDHDQDYGGYKDQDAPSPGHSGDLGLVVDFAIFDDLQDTLRLPLSSARARSATPPPRSVVSLPESVEAELKHAVRVILQPPEGEEQRAEARDSATVPLPP